MTVRAAEVAGPGPGLYYKSDDWLANKIAYSIPKAEKIDPALENTRVGPGYYKTEQSMGKKGISIPRTGRADLDGPDNPLGPGHYNISRDIVSKARGTFNKQKRILAGEEGNADPELAKVGPGAYTIEDDTFKKGNGKGVTILGKPRPQSATPGNQLGPGQYWSNRPESGTEAHAFGRGARGGLTWGETNKVGPGQYGSFLNKKFGGKGISFAKSTRDGVRNDINVGPGQYCAQTSKKIKPGLMHGTFGTAERRIGQAVDKDKDIGTQIGPGYYSTKDKKKGGWTFGRDERDFQYASDNPVGPGAYNIKRGLSQKLGIIGTSTRDGKKDKTISTPGFYKIPATVPDVPKYLLPEEKNRKIHL